MTTGAGTHLVVQVRTRQWIGGRRGDGWGSHVVNSLQRCGSFNTSLSARNRGNSEGRRGDSKPGLQGKRQRPPEWEEGPRSPPETIRLIWDTTPELKQPELRVRTREGPGCAAGVKRANTPTGVMCFSSSQPQSRSVG